MDPTFQRDRTRKPWTPSHNTQAQEHPPQTPGEARMITESLEASLPVWLPVLTSACVLAILPFYECVCLTVYTRSSPAPQGIRYTQSLGGKIGSNNSEFSVVGTLMQRPAVASRRETELDSKLLSAAGFSVLTSRPVDPWFFREIESAAISNARRSITAGTESVMSVSEFRTAKLFTSRCAACMHPGFVTFILPNRCLANPRWIIMQPCRCQLVVRLRRNPIIISTNLDFDIESRLKTLLRIRDLRNYVFLFSFLEYPQDRDAAYSNKKSNILSSVFLCFRLFFRNFGSFFMPINSPSRRPREEGAPRVG